MDINTMKVRSYRCAVCKMKLHNCEPSKINEHRRNHQQSEFDDSYFVKSIKRQDLFRIRNTGGKKRRRLELKLPKQKKPPQRSKIFKPNKINSSPDSFYETRAWMELRYKVLKVYGRKCYACGATDGPFHVDHIKPRSRYPSLELDFNNLQVLCKPCNLGKSNLDETDWRPHTRSR